MLVGRVAGWLLSYKANKAADKSKWALEAMNLGILPGRSACLCLALPCSISRRERKQAGVFLVNIVSRSKVGQPFPTLPYQAEKA